VRVKTYDVQCCHSVRCLLASSCLCTVGRVGDYTSEQTGVDPHVLHHVGGRFFPRLPMLTRVTRTCHVWHCRH
jgi:hypothetical protein